MPDYVIVGAGSAGCTLAARLSEDPSVSVTVIEAGGKGRHPNISIPAAFAKQFRTKLDWDYNTEPEPHCDGRSLYIPRGKGLGGSSSMNAMLYVRGRPLDYDLWARDGCDGLVLGRRAARTSSRPRTTSAARPSTTPWAARCNVADERSPRRLTARFLTAAEAAGIPRVPDYNGPEQDGASPVQVTQRNGARFSAADAYLRPNMKRPNLEVITHATVLGLELSGGRATGVRIRGRGRRERVISAAREVILSAGAIGSPQLLMLSGIGPADQLRSVGVPVGARPAGRRREPPRPPVRRRASGSRRCPSRCTAPTSPSRWRSGCCAAAGR